MNSPARFRIFENPDSACARAADGLAQLISERAILGRRVVLGLVAGETCLPFFKELIYRHREEGLSLGNVITFNTDAYVGLDGNHPASLQSFMQRHLFDHVDIHPNRIHFPPTSGDSIDAQGAKYEASIKRAGGVDYQVLRLRQNGGLGLQHPGIPNDGRTRHVAIEELLRERKAVEFGGIGKVPTHVVSLGDRTILKSRRIIVLAWGARKAYWVRRVIRGPVTPEASATYLQNHPSACFFVDAPAGRLLLTDDPEEPA
jgi:glucosamine-6-phosphate deaminase